MPAPNYSGFGSPIIAGSAAPGSGVDTSLDYGLYDTVSGKVISRKTRKPWSGKEPRSGKMFTNGVETANPQMDGVEVPYGGGARINPNDPNQRYKAVDIVKDPAIADATSSLLDSFKQSTSDALKGFDDYLKEFKLNTSAALEKSKSALDIQPTINEMRANQAKYNSDLDVSTAAQKAELDRARTDYAALNNQNAGTQRDIIQKQYDELGAFDRGTQEAAQAEKLAALENLSRYKLGPGQVPTGLGTEETNILTKNIGDIAMRMKQAQIAKRYDLYGNEANVERGIYGTEQNRVASFNPEVAAREFAASQGTAMQQFQSGQATVQTIQALKERVANMSIEQAIQFFNLLGVPAQIRQQILGGQISQLGQLGQLNELSRYRGLRDVLGAELSQPQGATFAANYPTPSPPSRYNNSQGPPYIPPLPARNAPTVVSPTTRPAANPMGTSSRYQADISGGGYFDNDTGDWYPIGTPAAGYGPSYTGDVNVPDYTYG